MMTKIAAAVLAALPLVAAAQASTPPAPPPAAPPAAQAPAAQPPPAQPAPQAQPQYPPQYAPPPGYTPAPPQGQYAPPPAQYPPPQGQYGQPAHPAPYGQPQPQPYPPQYAPPPVAPPRYQRGSWYIGFGLGGGDGSLKLPPGIINPAGGSTSFRDYIGASPTTVAINFKVGATLTPRLLLGGDITAVRSAATESGVDVAAQITNYDVVLTFFPTGKGFFVRGGAGLAKFSYDVSVSGSSVSNSENGASVLLGAGYAFWLGKSFNLTVNLDFAGQAYGSHDANADLYGALPKSSSMWALGVGFDWY